MEQRDLEILDEIVGSRGGFGHREHLELAWSLLRRYPVEEASEVMVAAIQHVARLHGAEDKYHETLTRVWLQLVAVHAQRWGAEDYERFIERNPDLLDRGLIEQFYSRELILGDPARAKWIMPDVRRLPAPGKTKASSRSRRRRDATRSINRQKPRRRHAAVIQSGAGYRQR